MTSSIGGGAVNLATLWVPVLPEVSGFASALAEGVVGGATAAVVNKFIGMFAEMGKEAAKGLYEIGKGVVEIGDIFDELNKRIVTFTDAQGTQLEQLKTDATKVFSELDTGTKNLGENLDVFHQRLGLIGPDLQKLTYDFTELTSRMGNLDVRKFTAVLDAFGVDGAHADDALRTLAGDAQHFGDTLTGLTSSMATAGPIFELLGIGFNSGAEAMAKIDALGPNAMKIMNGLAMAGKEFAKTATGGEDFKKFINDSIDAINYYAAEGPAGKGQAESLAATLFGTRQWAIVLRSLQDIKGAMDGVGSAGRQINVDKFVEDTRILSEQWDLFVHQLETDLKPVGEAAVQGLIGGIKYFGTYLDEHKGEILDKIKEYGDGFIQALPGIQRFVGEAVRLTGYFFDFFKTGAAVTLDTLSLIMQAWGTITGNDKTVKMGQGLMDMANTLNKLDFSKLSNSLGDLIEAPHIDTNAIQQKYDEAMGKVRDNFGGDTGKSGGGLGVSIDVHPVPKTPDGASLTDSKQVFGIPPDGLHVPVILDVPPSGAPGTAAAQHFDPSNLPPGMVLGPLSPSAILGNLPEGGVPTGPLPPGGAPVLPLQPGTAKPGGGDALSPNFFLSSGYQVALADYSTPMDSTHVVLTSGHGNPPISGGGYGKGGGGPSHSANQGYGSLGPDDLEGGGYVDAPGFPGGQVWVNPGEKASAAMQRAKKTADDADRMSKLTKQVGDLQAQKDAMAPTDPRAADIDKKLLAAKQALTAALETQTIDAQRQIEGTKGGGKGGSKSADPGDLIGPLMDMLGLGNVLGGTNPENWGIVKFGKALLGMFSGGGGGGGGFGGGGGGGGGGSSPLLDALGLGHMGSTGPGGGDSGGGDSGGPGGPAGGPPDGSGGGGGGGGGGGLNWDALAAKEAGGNWGNKSNPGGKYMGGLQFDQSTWDQFKPPGAPGNAADATKEQQIQAGMNAISSGRTPQSLWPTNYAQLNTPGPTGPAQSSGGPAPSLPSLPGVKSWFPPKAPPGIPALGSAWTQYWMEHPNVAPPGWKPPGGVPAPPQNRTSLTPGAAPAGFTGAGMPMPAGDSATYSTSLMQQLGIPPLATNPSGGGNPVLPQWLQDYVHQFGGPGLTATSTPHGSLHGVSGGPDFATDVVGPQDQMDRFAAYLVAHPGLSAQMIHQDPSGKDYGVAGGVALPQGAYYTTPGGSYGDEGDMVHWAPAGIGPGQPGGPVSTSSNVQPMAPGQQAPDGGAPPVHFAGDYMPMYVTPSAIDPQPAITQFQHQQNAQMASAGGTGLLPV